MIAKTHIPNKTSLFFKSLCKILYYFGIPNLWVEDFESTLIFVYFINTLTIGLVLFMICEWLSFLTQDSLTEKQASDRIVFCSAHPILFLYHVNVVYYKEDIKKMLYKLSVTLKEDYNDPKIERAFVKKAIIYDVMYSFTIVFALISYGFDAFMQILRSEGTFTTVITVWPLTTDESIPAVLMRIVWFFLWWAFMTRISTVYVVALSVLIAVNHQYKNLNSYFYNLNTIFHTNPDTDIADYETKVKKYEESLINGIKLHAETMWCAKQCQRTCGIVFGAQILINVTVLCLLMLQMVGSERTLMNALAIVATSTAVLTSMGFLMWNAGDITVEAALLPDAIYFSGWHHCSDASPGRLKKLLVLAITQSQVPVVLKSFGIVELSYQSFLTIVKSTYSVFSLLY